MNCGHYLWLNLIQEVYILFYFFHKFFLKIISLFHFLHFHVNDCKLIFCFEFLKRKWCLLLLLFLLNICLDNIGCLADVSDSMNPYATDRQMHDEGVSFEYVYKVRDDIKEGDTVIEVELEEPAPVRVKTPRGNRTPRGARKADKAARSEKSGDKTPRDGRRTPRGGADDDEATTHDDGPTKKVRVKGEKKRKASKADDDADDDDADVNLAEKTLGEY